ncbi:DUF2283 domain-containing protein [Thermosynechococcaceae cyanobacterium BACA0444]|uniref:DUF2283 domain-containing protein n=1 Tax=Pseudocalidococcus azoricus BACA0444 TaxID=2918990 RepID=A0AAE4FPN1_9CYAN|nr:DUF2283 domain-containing protein [Pseudocalidococcus azoricus]MDS3859939.1 DUF2283 domain-containing protein [Pseudocalidococcus azoricus BACA0444]
MKIVVHQADDALHIRLDDSPISASEEVSEGIIFDFNDQGKIVGIEVLYLSQRSSGSLDKIG